MATVTITSEEEFAKVLQHNDTLVLDFWAPWCAPCKGFAPVFEAVANQNEDMAFCRIKTEDAKELKEAFEVSSIPTLLIIRENVLVASHAGYMDKVALAKDSNGRLRREHVGPLQRSHSPVRAKRPAARP